MKVGIVGTLAAFRYAGASQNSKTGQADVIINGDHRFPTTVTSIKVLDQALCNFLIQVLSDKRNPIVAFTVWQNYLNKEVENIALDIVSVADELQEMEELDNGRTDSPAYDSTLAEHT